MLTRTMPPPSSPPPLPPSLPPPLPPSTPPVFPRRRSLAVFSRQELALTGVTMLWGVTFLLVRLAMSTAGPLFFVGLRFSFAGLLSLLFFHRRLAALNWREVRAGVSIGMAIFLGYGLQTFGLQSISGSRSAFITALYVPIVPLLQWLLLRNRPHVMAWLGIGLAFCGLLLLSATEVLPAQALPRGLGMGQSAGPGELATLLGAVAIAFEIILIGRAGGRVDLQRVTVVQLLTAGLAAFICMPLAGESMPAFSWVWLLAALGLGGASLLIQLVMNWAQKTLSPTRATLIYAGEPVWAGIAGALAGESLPALVLAGAALIVSGVLASELRPPRQPPAPP